MRRHTLTLEQAFSIQAEAESLLAGREHEVESTSVLELVQQSDCSAYDCEFVSLAIELRAVLVTADKQVLRAFPSQTRPLRDA